MGINNNYELQYKKLLKEVLADGFLQKVRDDNSAYASFGKSLEFNCNSNLFPMLTSKKMFFKNIKYELRWMLDGNTNVNYLKSNGVSIWDKWADSNGELGDTYGSMLRKFNGIDQISVILREFEKFYDNRQLVVSLWNPVAISQGNIKPCYHSFQFVYVKNRLNIIVSQRSADMFIGLPYDICLFVLLLYLVCKKYRVIPGTVKINIGNAHIYTDHLDAVKQYINNEEHDLPYLINNQNEVIGFDTSMVTVKTYISEDFINAKIII